MIRLGLLLALLLPASALAEAPLGHWFYYKKIYQGVEMPEPPEATLRLHFEFRPDGTSRLYWWHEGEDDLCFRHGRYQVQKGVIQEEATWIDPDNHPTCSRDPDMQPGRISRTPYRIVEGDLHLHLPFGDDVLVYVWKKIGP